VSQLPFCELTVNQPHEPLLSPSRCPPLGLFLELYNNPALQLFAVPCRVPCDLHVCYFSSGVVWAVQTCFPPAQLGSLSMAAIASYLRTCTCEDSKETKELYVYTARSSPYFLDDGQPFHAWYPLLRQIQCVAIKCISIASYSTVQSVTAPHTGRNLLHVQEPTTYTHMHAGTARMYDATRPL
jgi:hypothetical protein